MNLYNEAKMWVEDFFKQQKFIIDLGPVLAIRIEHVRT